MCLANRKLFINNHCFSPNIYLKGMLQKALVLETTNFSKNELAKAFDFTS